MKTLLLGTVTAALLHITPTVVLVDRKPLVEQWKAQLGLHLGLTKNQIGVVATSGKASGACPWTRATER